MSDPTATTAPADSAWTPSTSPAPAQTTTETTAEATTEATPTPVTTPSTAAASPVPASSSPAGPPAKSAPKVGDSVEVKAFDPYAGAGGAEVSRFGIVVATASLDGEDDTHRDAVRIAWLDAVSDPVAVADLDLA